MTGAASPGRPAWKEVRALLEEQSFFPSRRLGQNFLLDENMVQRIALDTELGAGDFLLEIGAGCGFLTSHLAALGAEIVSVEIDRRLLAVASQLLEGSENVRFLRADVLAGKHQLAAEVLEELPDRNPWHAVGNLPYSIASPLMVVLSRLDWPPETMTVLIQAEVAERIAARPGTRPWGPISARLQKLYRAEYLRTVPPQLFWPRPKVDSAVLRLTRLESRPGSAELVRFDDLVSELFRSRRKAILGLLARLLEDREQALELLGRLGLKPDSRAGELSTDQLGQLAESPEWKAARADPE